MIQRLRSRFSERIEPVEDPAPSLPQPVWSGAAIPPQEEYLAWLSRHEPTTADLQAMRSALATWPDRPLVSVLMPVYNPRRSWLQEAVGSVLGQVYPEWELCLADDASPDEDIRRALKDLSASDPRIKVSLREQNGGIAEASATTLSMAKGDIAVLLDHDDVLRPHALFVVAERFCSDPTVDMVYSDEDKILLDGRPGHPAFKPAWSPHYLLSTNYICHLTAMRTALAREAGGFRPGFDGSQDHDLFLRVSERARKIEHIPLMLYGWRQVPGSAALAVDAKPAAHEAGVRAVSDALNRRGIAGRAETGVHAGLYNVRCTLERPATAEIFVPVRGDAAQLRQCISSIKQQTSFDSFRITIIDSRKSSPCTENDLTHPPHKVVRWAGPSNLGAMLDAAWRSTASEYLVFLRPQVAVNDPEWLTVMLEQAQVDDVAVVGCVIRDRAGYVQSCGIKIVDGEAVTVSSMRWPVIRDVSALSDACVMISRTKIEALGGFDDRYSSGVAVTDLCLRAVQSGLYNVFTPLTSVTDSAETCEEASRNDALLLKRVWKDGGVDANDPFESVHVISWDPLHLRGD